MKNAAKSFVRWIAWLALRADEYTDAMKSAIRTHLIPGLVTTGVVFLLFLFWDQSKLVSATVLGAAILFGLAAYTLRTSAPQKTPDQEDDTADLVSYYPLGRGLDAIPAFLRRNVRNFPAPVQGSSYYDEVPAMPDEGRHTMRRGWLH